MKSATALNIRIGDTSATTPEHQRFNKLLAKIETARTRLQQWQQQAPLFAQAFETRVVPERQQFQQSQRAWVLELEQVLLSRRWTRVETQTLTRALVDISGALLAQTDPPDEDLKALYNRHAEVDYGTETQEDLASLKELFEDLTGMDLGDEPVDSAEALFQQAQEKMARAQAHLHEQAAAQAERKARQKKRGRPSAARQRDEEAALQVSQTVRAVYRKLAAALHPDRIASTATDAERAQRTAQMQRANTAYEKNDLLALLSLQLDIEQLSAIQASQMAADQVQHFNQVLREQLREIERDIRQRQAVFEDSFGLEPQPLMDPMQLNKLLNKELRAVQLAHIRLQQERRNLQGPPALVKAYLKMLRQAQQEQDDEAEDLFW